MKSYVVALVLAGITIFELIPAASAESEASLTYMETAGRYADLEQEAEKRISNGDKVNSTLLGYLCISYGKLKQYEKLFDCTAKLDTSIQRGDTAMDLDQHVMFISSSDVRPLPDLLRAQAYFELGDYQRATSSGKQVLETLKRIPETGGTSLYPTVRFQMLALEILGISAARVGDEKLAMSYARQLEDTSTPFIGGRMWGWIQNNSLAQLYMSLGQYKEALRHIPDTSSGMQIIVSFVNGLGPYAYLGDSTTTILELPRRAMRGIALEKTGHISGAKSMFDQILSSPRIKDVGDIYWVVLFERGYIAEEEKDSAKATELYAKAVDVIEQQRSSISTEASKIGFVGDKQAVYARLISVLVEQGKAAEAFDYVERSKSRALVDMLASKKDFATPGEDPEKVKQVLAQLDAADLAAQAQTGTARNGENSGVRNLTLARQEIRTTAPELSALVTVSSVPSKELGDLVGANEALVEYYYQGNDLYAFVLDRQQLQVVKLDGTGLVEQVQAFRKTVEDPANSSWQAASQALYQRLWQPLQGMLNASELIIVPHGVLHYLPFEALQAPDGHLLIERYGMRMLPSASLLKFLPPALPKTAAPLLVLGNPDLGDSRLDLQFAEAEARTVAGMVHGSRLLVRKEASETNFKNAGGVFTRIHFATHGKFQADQPLDSGLYLTKDAANDGVLTVGELYSMHLDADLVTLSACETGLGKVANGDDVVGLTRGFLYAGSRSIVASLWSVDDKATSELMESFYANLSRMNKEDALRQAQLKTRQSFPHPFYWAAFQLTGRAN